VKGVTAIPAAAVVDGTAAAHGRQQRRPMLRVAADSMMLNNATTRIGSYRRQLLENVLAIIIPEF